jgi:hypothetical protein
MSTRFFILMLATAVTGFLCVPSLSAQQIDCTVKVNYESVGGAYKDLLQEFETNVRTYLNSQQWGSEQMEEKIHCTFDIFVQGVTGENRYIAQVFIGSQRPIYGANKNTAVARLFDEAWEFTYLKQRPLNHTPHSFNELTSFLDFYIYLILGYDFDTYESLAGNPWFQKASDVASLGRSTSQQGWQPVTSGYSRTQLATELMNPTVSGIRAASYVYHFGGLDSLGVDKAKAFSNIARALDMIGATRKHIDSRNLVFKTFFDTKYLELAEVLQDYPDRSIYQQLSRVDPSHQSTYEEYRKKE